MMGGIVLRRVRKPTIINNEHTSSMIIISTREVDDDMSSTVGKVMHRLIVIDKMADAELKQHHAYKQAHEQSAQIGVSVARQTEKHIAYR